MPVFFWLTSISWTKAFIPAASSSNIAKPLLSVPLKLSPHHSIPTSSDGGLRFPGLLFLNDLEPSGISALECPGGNHPSCCLISLARSSLLRSAKEVFDETPRFEDKKSI